MEENLIDDGNNALHHKRPAFLAILCILTWIGSVLAAVVNAAAVLLLWYVHQKVYADWQILALFGFVVGSVICTVGAIRMWRLQRKGFYMYMVGELLPMILLLLDMSSRDLTKLHWLKFFSLIGWIVVPATFMVLYSLNIKHLR